MSAPDVSDITVDGVAVQTIQTAITEVPFIPFNKRPTFRWTASDADSDPLTYQLEIIWEGVRDVGGMPTIVAVAETTKTGLTKKFYTLRTDEELQYSDIEFAGGDYHVKVTASDGASETMAQGWFRVNHVPSMPIGLRII